MRIIVLILISVSLFLTLLINFSIFAEANPIITPKWDDYGIDPTFKFNSPLSGIFWLILMNLFVNLFWFSLFMLISCKRFGIEVGNLFSEKGKFLLSVLTASISITLIGAIIDFEFLIVKIQPGHSFGYAADEYIGYYVLVLNWFNWLIASILIFISILLCSFFIVRLKWIPSLIPSFSIASLNIVWWLLIWLFGGLISLTSVIFFLLSFSFPLYELLKWHAEKYSPSIALST